MNAHTPDPDPPHEARGLPRLAVVALDRQLAQLGRGLGALRLRLGEAIESFAAGGGHLHLGFSNLADYAHQRCERTGRWAADSRAIARRLANLPKLRAALISGQLSWSMTELLARNATPDTEVELIAAAHGTTIRAMREALRPNGGDADDTDNDDDTPRRLTLQTTVDRATAVYFEATRTLVRRLDHCPTNEDVVECMLGEAMGTLFTLDQDAPHEHDHLADREMAQAWRDQLDTWRREAEEACEPRIDTDLDQPEQPTAPDDEPELPTTHEALDAHIVRLCQELAQRDLLLGDLARRFWHANGWRRLGYASSHQYVRERVALSHSSLDQRMRLSRRSARLPQVAEALVAGRVGFEAANLVARVAAPSTIEAWLDRATQRTVKHLREEVEIAETLTRLSNDTSYMVPPDEETVADYQAWETDTLSAGPMLRAAQKAAEMSAQMSGGPSTDALEDEKEDEEEAPSQMSGGPSKARSDDEPRLRRGGGKVTFRFNLEEDLYWLWRQLEADWQRLHRPGPFLRFMCDAMWETWRHALLEDETYKDTFQRDRYECASPVCTNRRNLNPHHIEYRSKGGGDEPENLIAVCATCHLFGIHEGRLAVAPPASDPMWILGRDRWLTILGRNKLDPSQS